MTTLNDTAVAAAASVDATGWHASFEALMNSVGARFARVEPRRHVRAFVLGLLSDVPGRNCWTLAEQAGHAGPDALQHLLSRARWDADALRDDVRGYVAEHLADPDGVLVLDETGDVKKGTATVGVARQYTGTAGRVENAQVAVFLAYAGAGGHALVDRALYLPRSWTEDPERCQAAGIPKGQGFATKPALAGAMVTDALDAGVPARWVAADTVYGTDPKLRGLLENRGVGYVLAVARDHRVTTNTGTHRVDTLAGRLPGWAWHSYSAGPGAKGQRYYDWAWLDVDEPARPGFHGLLIRRHPRTGELAFYRTHSRQPAPLAALVRVAGRRWVIEESFQTAKTLTGLDEHQVRTWTSWHRWTTLAMLAAAFLAVLTATTRDTRTHEARLIPLTLAELRRLFLAVTHAHARDLTHRLRWSRWRRRHQHRARTSHYQQRAHA